MKAVKQILVLTGLILIMFSNITHSQTTKTIGSGGDYTTLKLAFDAINAGTITGTITLQIIGSTTETALAVLNANGSGGASYSSITIYPTVSGKSISGNLASPLIDLNGADNVTFDGRVNASGSSKDLVITNTNTGTSASTIRFINSAENNTVKYCNIKGSETSASLGIIFFSTSTAGNGNDNNLIDNNNITSDAAGRPANAIYSAGTSGRDNSGITISNNNIYDVWLTTASSYSIQLSSYTSACTITGNSFYETTTFVPTRGWTYNAIRISNTTGNSFNITDNYIGGQAAQCGGSAFMVNADTTHLFNGIYINVGTTTASSLQNNIIKNFNYTSKSTGPWQGINITAGAVNIGTITGNTIGAVTGTGSIIVTGSITATNVYGIYITSTGIVDCRNNIIGSITTSNASANSNNLHGIYKSGTGTLTIINNTIGSTSTANSINTGSASTGSAQIINGIYSSGSGTIIINSNTIANVTNSTTNTTVGTAGLINGITSTSGTITVSNNTIRDLIIANANTSATNTTAVCGIALTGATLKTVSGNIIYNLSNTYASFAGNVVGLYFTGISTSTNIVNGNFIYNLSCNASSTSAKVYGIKVASGTTTYSNNIINLGGNTATTIYGIYETGAASNNNNLYFNSVYIGGSLSSGVTAKSYALYSAVTTNTRNFRNNIFDNSRSTTGGSSLHYAAYFAYAVSTSLTLDNNDYYAPGTGGVLGYYNSINKITLPIVTGLDAVSLAINPGFVTPGGTSATDYYTSASLPGVSGTGVTTDFNGITRSGAPKMGALEINNYVWQGGINNDFNTAGNWVPSIVPSDGADISFAANPANHCVLDQNRTLGSITNAQGIYQLVVNGKQLTINGNLVFSNGAKINASANLSVVVFAGSSAQSIPSGTFVSNIVDAITVNNSNGLTLNGDLTITQTLTLTNGAFTIGANTLTINGAITTTSGTLTGGSSTNISIGGSGASTSLPAVSLNNFTINRTNGISIGGNVSVAGTLALTAGTMVVGVNIFTYSGNSLTKTSGYIDASNASATLVFANTSAITLPASIFSGNVNNLTITGAGGITASSDFTVNGVLNLQSTNPSATKGSLDLWDGSTLKTLNMGEDATTIGVGDVTGVVARTSTFVANKPYTFGNQFTIITFASGGTYPTQLQAKTTIGIAPSWKPGAIKRINDFIRTGGTGCFVTVASHYLDEELNGNDEEKIVRWKLIPPSTVTEVGRTDHSSTDNWVANANIAIANLPLIFGSERSLANSELVSLIWNGSVSNVWITQENWTPRSSPSNLSAVIIPNASTTPNDPTLPGIAEIKSLTIEAGGILNSDVVSQLTINGGNESWSNAGGVFNAGTSTVIFTNAAITISGVTDFFNLTINSGAGLTMGDGSTLRIGGTLTNNGTWNVATLMHNVVEYNGGNQTVLNPNGLTSGYHSLILSGNGTKTMPGTALNLDDDFFVSGTTTVTAAAPLTIAGDVTIGNGSSFITGNYDHSIGGSIDNNGNFTASTGYTITMNGSSAQSVLGTSTTNFGKLTINNSNGVVLYSNININNILTLTSGNLSVQTNNLGINGTINKTSGHIEVSPVFSLSFGGTEAITLTSDLFTTLPSINNLTINRTNSITLGQDLTINGILTLTNGLIILGDKNLILGTSATIEGSPSANSMIVATSTGELRKIIGDERILPFTFTYPVGDNDGTAEYSPVTLNFTSGTFSSAYASVTLGNSKYSNNLSTIDYLNRYWTVNQNGISDFSCDVTAQYLVADVVGTESSIWTGKYDGSSWTLLNQANAVNHTLTGTVTGFSTFTGGQQASMPVELSAFNSSVNGRDVKLQWVTSSETNNAGFEIQKSVLGNNNSVWNKIGYINGNGTKNTPTNYSFIDSKLNAGKFQYRLKQIDNNGNFAYHILNNTVEIGVPSIFTLSQNYPNPFNPKTKIDFQIPNDTKVTMKIYDITGREIVTLINNEFKKADYYTVDFNPINVASGVYFYRIIADKFIATKKMVLIK
ncbi:MAG: T9SS type A sorting domain-containing protein [Ignavibacteriae bacterium]|nr:T9SS type A sorting domain-containing protein [Ignavibacteriota bacterium]